MSHEHENEHGDLRELLTESRPEPTDEFADRLDRAVTDGFPPEWAQDRPARTLADRVRRRLTGPGGRRVLLPAVAGLCGILFVATVVIKAGESTGPEGPAGFGAGTATQQKATTDESGSVDGSAGSAADREGSRTSGSGKRWGLSAGQYAEEDDEPGDGTVRRGIRTTGDLAPLTSSPEVAGKGGRYAPGVPPLAREVARNAKITLGTDPDKVQDVANQVVKVVDRYRGFVLNSEVTDGPKGRAGAEFALRIPAGSLEKAIADLSGISDLRSRSQGLTDITAPIDSNTKRIRKAKGRIEVLRTELEQTADPVEQRRLENRIRARRWSIRAARLQLKRLKRRVDYAPVFLSVVTSADSSSDGSSKWGLSNALDDAGHILATAAGVAVLALAVAIPIGLVVLLALALNRAWVRRSRRRVLEEE